MEEVSLRIANAFLIHSQSFAQQFKVRYTQEAFNGPFTGQILLYLSKESRTPKEAMVGVESFPCFSVSVENIKPATDVIIDDKAVSYPVRLSDTERGEYSVQVVWDRNLGGRSIGASPGNLYNRTQKVNFVRNPNTVFPILCDQTIPSPVFKETRFAKELRVPSALLSDFHKKPMTVDAAILLPKEYLREPNRKFPVLFLVSGYGGDYHRLPGQFFNIEDW